MKIRRLSDRSEGWAVQMAGQFRMGGRTYAKGTWIVELDHYYGGRFTLPTDRMNAEYQPLVPVAQIGTPAR